MFLIFWTHFTAMNTCTSSFICQVIPAIRYVNSLGLVGFFWQCVCILFWARVIIFIFFFKNVNLGRRAYLSKKKYLVSVVEKVSCPFGVFFLQHSGLTIEYIGFFISLIVGPTDGA